MKLQTSSENTVHVALYFRNTCYYFFCRDQFLQISLRIWKFILVGIDLLKLEYIYS